MPSTIVSLGGELLGSGAQEGEIDSRNSGCWCVIGKLSTNESATEPHTLTRVTIPQSMDCHPSHDVCVCLYNV